MPTSAAAETGQAVLYIDSLVRLGLDQLHRERWLLNESCSRCSIPTAKQCRFATILCGER